MSTPPSASDTRTPPPSVPSVGSSPVKRITKYFVAHKRDEFQAFGYVESIHDPISFESSVDFLDFLSFEDQYFRAPDTTPDLSMNNFIVVANGVANSIKEDHFPDKELLEFKYTGGKPLLGHVTDTDCRPDIVAAFKNDWNNGNTHWSCAQLAGEKASKGKNKLQQKQNAISYLHFLMLSRPDLYVAQGLLTDKAEIKFFFGIGGSNIRLLNVSWDDEALYKLLYAFIYRLYDPGNFADKSCVRTDIDWNAQTVDYTVQINIPSSTPDGSTRTLDCTNFRPISARNPFTSRTHVLSNASFQGDVPLTVLKDQLCRAGARFEEETILSGIHRRGVVPGVVEAVHHETIESPWSKRVKHRLGLRQMGLPFTSVPTARKMLEVLFDTLEVIRYLHSECHVLHRDISAGNVMYMEDPDLQIARPSTAAASAQIAEPSTAAASALSSGPGDAPTALPVFVKYLLGDSNDPQQTSTLLIDFNCAEHLKDKQGPEYKRVDRTGTPLFIARAVEAGEAMPLRVVSVVPPVPPSPESYTAIHSDRVKKFPCAEEFILNPKAIDVAQAQGQWRHDLDHDAESVFWLLLYWAMVAQPIVRDEDEYIDPWAWLGLLGQATRRNSLVRTIAGDGAPPRLTHSIYKPLCQLIEDLASILVVDRQWLSKSDVRNDPAYICEAFQRSILQFILDHRDQEFMNHEVDVQFRQEEKTPAADALSTTQGERMAALDRKRPSRQPSTEDVQGKRRRLDVARPQAENQADVGMENAEDDDEDDPNYEP